MPKKAKKTVKRVFVVTATSESGDNYGPWTFSKEPTDEELLAFLKEVCEQEFPLDDEEGEGPGFGGSYLHIESRGWVSIRSV